jgi:4'-phosphopantetheinyl transferase
MVTPLSPWRLPHKLLTLGNDEVHVWRASLDLKAARVQSLQQTLSGDERARAGRFHFQKDREHFVVARGVLRAILGGYLDIEPGQVRFCYGAHGKPTLAQGAGKPVLRFNLSHAHGLVLYALARGRELGIDVEHLRPQLVNERVAEQFFSRGEVAVLRGLPADEQQKAFFDCWTRKEAYIKARGEGLSLRLDQFEVSLAPGAPAALLSSDGDPREACRWALKELSPGPGYMAALAVEGHGWRLTCWQWPEE